MSKIKRAIYFVITILVICIIFCHCSPYSSKSNNSYKYSSYTSNQNLYYPQPIQLQDNDEWYIYPNMVYYININTYNYLFFYTGYYNNSKANYYYYYKKQWYKSRYLKGPWTKITLYQVPYQIKQNIKNPPPISTFKTVSHKKFVRKYSTKDSSLLPKKSRTHKANSSTKSSVPPFRHNASGAKTPDVKGNILPVSSGKAKANTKPQSHKSNNKKNNAKKSAKKAKKAKMYKKPSSSKAKKVKKK